MSLLNTRAKNHPKREVNHAVDDRRTPRPLFDALDAEFGFTLDAAASEENKLCKAHFSRISDGLLCSWHGWRVFCNPPWSRLEAWVAKAFTEVNDNDCPLAVLLLPANRCEQPFWHRYIEQYRDGRVRDPDRLTVETRFLLGRTRWIVPGKIGRAGSPPFGCVVVIFTRREKR